MPAGLLRHPPAPSPPGSPSPAEPQSSPGSPATPDIPATAEIPASPGTPGLSTGPAAEAPLPVIPRTGTGAPPRSGGGRVRLPLSLVVLLGALTAVPSLSLDFYLPGLPGIRAALGTSQAVAQLTMTGCLFGFAVGLLLAGPLSDSFGRRRPLLVGIALYVVATLGCALAPGIGVLVGCRFLQGAAGAFGMVTGTAVVRDRASGPEAARLFSVLMLANGAAPILGPVLGAQLLPVTGWRGLFVALAVVGTVTLIASWRRLPETLPVARRRPAAVPAVVSTFGFLLRDRRLVGFTLGRALGAAALLAYVSASPFVFQGVYGLSAQQFSAVFAVNSAGLIGMGQLSGRLVHRVGPAALLTTGSVVCAAGSVWLVLALLVHAPLLLVLPGVFAVVAGMGMVFPNSTALGLSRHGNCAGAATALMGVVQFGLQALASPLTGLGGGGSALPMAVVVLVLDVGALVALLTLARPARAGVVGRLHPA